MLLSTNISSLASKRKVQFASTNMYMSFIFKTALLLANLTYKNHKKHKTYMWTFETYEWIAVASVFPKISFPKTSRLCFL
jgi:hypothetical protein